MTSEPFLGSFFLAKPPSLEMSMNSTILQIWDEQYSKDSTSTKATTRKPRTARSTSGNAPIVKMGKKSGSMNSEPVIVQEPIIQESKVVTGPSTEHPLHKAISLAANWLVEGGIEGANGVASWGLVTKDQTTLHHGYGQACHANLQNGYMTGTKVEPTNASIHIAMMYGGAEEHRRKYVEFLSSKQSPWQSIIPSEPHWVEIKSTGELVNIHSVDFRSKYGFLIDSSSPGNLLGNFFVATRMCSERGVTYLPYWVKLVDRGVHGALADYFVRAGAFTGGSVMTWAPRTMDTGHCPVWFHVNEDHMDALKRYMTGTPKNLTQPFNQTGRYTPCNDIWGRYQGVKVTTFVDFIGSQMSSGTKPVKPLFHQVSYKTSYYPLPQLVDYLKDLEQKLAQAS